MSTDLAVKDAVLLGVSNHTLSSGLAVVFAAHLGCEKLVNQHYTSLFGQVITDQDQDHGCRRQALDIRIKVGGTEDGYCPAIEAQHIICDVD